MRRCGARMAGATVMACALTPAAARAAEATASIAIQAHVSSRTALTVSTESLRFEVVHPGESATATVDFQAAARTHAGAPVVLSIEVLHARSDRSDRGDAAPGLSFTGRGEGTLGGVMAPASPAVAARWIGSGRRAGRLVFALQSHAPGTYEVPVRFVLTAP